MMKPVSLCIPLCVCVCIYIYAAKSLQLCLTLCDPIDGSPPGSSIPGILQARTLEREAIYTYIASLILNSKDCLQCRTPGLNPWVKKIPRRREWVPTPVFLPGEFPGQKTLATDIAHGVTKSQTSHERFLSPVHIIVSLL